VQAGRFGACLMAEPELVAQCVAAMAGAVSIPVTVKCRIGIDDSEEFSFLNSFIKEVSNAGCQKFIIHARKAWLNGLSPKENREVPPLRYEIAQQVKEAYPQIEIILNGGVKTITDIRAHLSHLCHPRESGDLVVQMHKIPAFAGMTSGGFDGVMIGREAYQNPWLLAEIEKEIHDDKRIISRETIALAMIPYIEEQRQKHGTPVKSITRHILGLFNGERGARAWRRYLSENAHRENAGGRIIEEALSALSPVAQAA
jgi:tRNA-dihydrouridine synthase A